MSLQTCLSLTEASISHIFQQLKSHPAHCGTPVQLRHPHLHPPDLWQEHLPEGALPPRPFLGTRRLDCCHLGCLHHGGASYEKNPCSISALISDVHGLTALILFALNPIKLNTKPSTLIWPLSHPPYLPVRSCLDLARLLASSDLIALIPKCKALPPKHPPDYNSGLSCTVSIICIQSRNSIVAQQMSIMLCWKLSKVLLSCAQVIFCLPTIYPVTSTTLNYRLALGGAA